MLGYFNWNGLLSPPIIGTILGCLIPIVWIVMASWSQVEKARSLDQLKRTLAERGLSAAEIEQIVRANPKEQEDQEP